MQRAMTSAERQEKRRAQFNEMRAALVAIVEAKKLAEAHEIARAALPKRKPGAPRGGNGEP